MAEDRMNEAMTIVTSETGKTEPTYKPVKTYYLSWELIERIERLAQEWGASQSAVVKWLLARGLEAVAKGEKPEMETVTRAKLD